ncbi:MAG: hypothetical protein ACYC1M_17160 [Armatimonadota bacterium]
MFAFRHSISLLALSLLAGSAMARDVMPDTWVATDGAQRTLPGYAQVGPVRSNKTVGMFYFNWHTPGMPGPYDTSKITKGEQQWGGPGAFHWWTEPEIGYYQTADEWVIKRHCHQLTTMGVDVIVLDVTNAFVYKEAYMALFRVFTELRAKGESTPQIAFIAWAGSDRVAKSLYDDLYSKGLYKPLWFMWKGKPLLLANMEKMPEEYKQFFTMRETWAWNGGQRKDYWTWLDNYPQGVCWDEPGEKEELSVSVGHHATTNKGRSFHDGVQPSPDKVTPELAPNYDEQWKRAFEVDPKFVFITGFNEWIAQRFINDGNTQFLGKAVKGETFFVDSYDREFNRDIEPMKGDYTDNTFYQTIAKVRQYKGVRPLPLAGAPKSIKVDGNPSDWANVKPVFRDWIDDTATRDSVGCGGLKYINKTGRNDLMDFQVSRDKKNIYFLAQTRQNIVGKGSDNWMLLFIDTDANFKTGWMGYDYLIDTGVVKKWDGTRFSACGKAVYAVKGNSLELAIPKVLLGLGNKKSFNIDFKWADNIQKIGSIEEFFNNGDVAPDRRFNYRYQVK